ncbi:MULTISPECIES: GntR family transcriptional regulator [Streptomyces]|uniref:GntR family transcriptional regulator n=1 Tax=Streptomyces TaxID=1883 RepID=UPI001EFB6AB0|nr:GntR family transcriptional regulator [Streptomyces sp. CL12-4]MCG8966819.1 GntR family transcriptional regulator [Streptomyces sp. CL12-4]
MSDGTVADGGGREFERVAGVLRARMADGTYPLRSLLPPERELAEQFGVSRSTVQRVMTELRSEGWIETRQGSGSRVVRTQWIHSPTSSKRPDRRVTLGPLISQAFEQPEVTLDVYTLTSESLDAHIRLQTERIRAEEIAPQRIALRMLLPSEDLELPYWRTGDRGDDQMLRERLLGISRRHAASLRTVLSDLRTMKLVPSVDFEIRRVIVAPTYKLYLVNRTAALFGPYEVFERSIELDDGRVVEATDVFGLGARLTHHVKEDDPYATDTVFVETMQGWFDSVWKHLTGGS